jgi:TDG/mug DNA glycosylase family protein
MSAPTGTFFEEVAALAGVGFTDLVRRPSIRENDVSRVELAHGRARLERTLADSDVPQVICVFRQPAEALLGLPTKLGYQEERTSWGARVFRMPGPFEKREVVAAVMATIRL